MSTRADHGQERDGECRREALNEKRAKVIKRSNVD